MGNKTQSHLRFPASFQACPCNRKTLTSTTTNAIKLE